jgi:hypothetical protein
MVADGGEVLSYATISKLLEEDERWKLARRLITSKRFVKSPFLCGFLLYVCEKHLLNLDEEITEQQIGIAVFGRPPGYNVGDDNIVRNYARILRQRLDTYFKTEGSGETIHIVIPRGGYIPLFLDSGGNFAETQPAQSGSILPTSLTGKEIEQPAKRTSRDKLVLTLVLTCTLLTLALAASWIHWTVPSKKQAAQNRFWSAFFNASQDTFLVPGDSGLAIYENLTKSQVDLGSYVRGDYQHRLFSPFGFDPKLVSDLGERRYTSVVSLNLVSTISRLPEVVPSRLKIRYARELQMDDLKQSNAILIGSISSNPWVELFQKDMNFQFSFDPGFGTEVIHNLHPLPGESAIYRTQENTPARTTYGVIAVLPNLTRSGNVMLMEGMNMAGTEGASEFLFNALSSGFTSRIFRKDGTIQPFEVLIETSNFGANAPEPKVLSFRTINL